MIVIAIIDFEDKELRERTFTDPLLMTAYRMIEEGLPPGEVIKQLIIKMSKDKEELFNRLVKNANIKMSPPTFILKKEDKKKDE